MPYNKNIYSCFKIEETYKDWQKDATIMTQITLFQELLLICIYFKFNLYFIQKVKIQIQKKNYRQQQQNNKI